MLTKADIVDIIFNAVTSAPKRPQTGGAGCVLAAEEKTAKALKGAGFVSKENDAAVRRKKLIEDDDADGCAKVFLSDYELRKKYVKGTKIIEVPLGSIVSPLAQDWIDFEGIKVVFK